MPIRPNKQPSSGLKLGISLLAKKRQDAVGPLISHENKAAPSIPATRLTLKRGPLMLGNKARAQRPTKPEDPKRVNPRNWRVRHDSDGYWVTGIPYDCSYQECGEMGPFKDTEQVNDRKRGLQQFLEIDQYAEPTNDT